MSRPRPRFLNPYNFVRYLNPNNVKNKDSILGKCRPPTHDRFFGLNGIIECELEAITPIFVSNSEYVKETEKQHFSYQFFRLGEKDQEIYAIPSTTLRGTIRSVYEAITNSCFSVFEGGLLGKRERPERYDKNLVLRAGIIVRIPRNDDTPGIVKEMTAYPLPHSRFHEFQDKVWRNGEKIQVLIRNNRVVSVNQGGTEGYLKTSGRGIPGKTRKKNEYIFVEQNPSKTYILTYEKYLDYIISNRNNRHENTKKPQPNDTIWFRAYQNSQNINEFGYAQLYRKPFKKSIKDLLDPYYHTCTDFYTLCPTCRVFGWVHPKPPKDIKIKTAYAGRIKISSALITFNNGTLKEFPLAILSSPKPTTHFFYLFKNHRPDYHAKYEGNNSQIRGRKFYLHHKTANQEEYIRKYDKNPRDKQNRTIRDALKKGNKFSFSLSFENLSPIELGALIWSIEMEEGMHHKLGMAKPYGFGSVKFKILQARILSIKERYSSLSNSGWSDLTSDKLLKYVNLFKTEMKNVYGNDFELLNNFKDLKAISSASILPIYYPRLPNQRGQNFRWFERARIPLNFSTENREGLT